VNVIPYSYKPDSPWTSLIPQDTDILHLWATPNPLPQIPFLVTIEGNGRVGETFHPNTVFVSRKHAELHGAQYFVHNGIDPTEFECNETREDYVVFLAKAAWKVKNLKGAIEIARSAGLPLKVMGSRDLPLNLNRYVTPTWNGVQYCGMLGDIEKRKILKQAKALLFPVRWHEPFGIAITEALASGCPVFGTPYGSLPEIISPETGILSTSARELASALVDRRFSPMECRRRVNQGFTHLQMAENYLKYYAEILNQGTLNQTSEVIRFRGQEPAETLLPWEGISVGT